jgi:hypothetical protein
MDDKKGNYKIIFKNGNEIKLYSIKMEEIIKGFNSYIEMNIKEKSISSWNDIISIERME